MPLEFSSAFSCPEQGWKISSPVVEIASLEFWIRAGGWWTLVRSFYDRNGRLWSVLVVNVWKVLVLMLELLMSVSMKVGLSVGV